jgi:hypothetical protein
VVRVGGDGDDDWNTWRRKEAETYGRGCPADVSQYAETMVPGTCFSSRRAMFDDVGNAHIAVLPRAPTLLEVTPDTTRSWTIEIIACSRESVVFRDQLRAQCKLQNNY